MTKPTFDKSPGLIVRAYGKDQWEVRWQARTDLAKRGFKPSSISLWVGVEPTEVERAMISERCRGHQTEMLVWGRGEPPVIERPFDGYVDSLFNCYLTDPDSTYHTQRYRTRINTRNTLKAIARTKWTDDSGTERTVARTQISEVSGRIAKRWYKIWTAEGKISMAHDMVARLRTAFGFGFSILEDKECERLCGVMGQMRFPAAKKKRKAFITADQATAVREMAHRCGRASIALAQSFQFDLMLRQRDVIGERIPISEPGITDIVFPEEGLKWLRGLRWEEIDSNLLLTHETSKKEKELTVNLRNAPMIMEELRKCTPAALKINDTIYAAYRAAESDEGRAAVREAAEKSLELIQTITVTRSDFPASGPIIISEETARPYGDHDYRRRWRMLARLADVPDNVKNMHSRAGAITEATDAGADIEKVRHAATHSNITTTQGYSRNAEGKTDEVLRLRAAYRNRQRTERA